MNKIRTNKGFTLVELLVVIAIIGILAVVAVPALFKNIEKGKIADLESDISAVRSAVLSFYAEESRYPSDNIEIDNNADNNISNGDIKKIEDELEGLSIPFGGHYLLENAINKHVVHILIDGKKITESGLKKLKNDLGEDNIIGKAGVGKIAIVLVNKK